MPDLPQNVTYKSLRGAIAPMIKTAQDIGRTLPQPSRKSKRVDVSGYRNLMNQMGNYRTAQSTPATIGNLGSISVPYMGSTKFEPGGTHMGVDIANKMGTPIPAFAGGTVTESVTGKQHGEPGYGNYIKIVDSEGREWRYSHLESNFVPVGARVNKGQIIAGMGATGQTYSTHYTYDPTNPNTRGSHLDLRIRDIYGKYLNPTAYISS